MVWPFFVGCFGKDLNAVLLVLNRKLGSLSGQCSPKGKKLDSRAMSVKDFHTGVAMGSLSRVK